MGRRASRLFQMLAGRSQENAYRPPPSLRRGRIVKLDCPSPPREWGRAERLGGGCGQGGRCNPAFRTLQGWSLSVEPVSGPRSPDDEGPNNMESGKMAPPKNAPRDALVSAKDESGHMKLRAAGDPGVRPRWRACRGAHVPSSAQP